MAVYLNDSWKDEEEGGALRCFPRTDTTTHDVTVGVHEEPAGSRSFSTASVQVGGGRCTLYRVVGSSLSSLDKDRGRWILSSDVPVIVDVNRDDKDHGQQRGVDDPRRHTGGGDAGPFDSITLPHLVDEGYGIETEDRGHIRLGG